MLFLIWRPLNNHRESWPHKPVCTSINTKRQVDRPDVCFWDEARATNHMIRLDDLDATVRDQHLENYAADLHRLGTSAIWLDGLACEDDLIPATASKIGGLPALANSVEWPRNDDGEELHFIAQVNLADIPRSPGFEHIPSAGMMSFFYDAESQPWGPEGSDSWRVIYQGPGPELPKRESLETVSPYRSQQVCLDAFLSFPNLVGDWSDADEFAEGGLRPETTGFLTFVPEDDAKRLFPLYSPGRSILHQLFGYPIEIQADIRALLQDVHGEKWSLLAQFDSDVEVQWGDGGRLYFMIRERDFLNFDLSHIVGVLQSY